MFKLIKRLFGQKEHKSEPFFEWEETPQEKKERKERELLAKYGN